jgi:hypothetical protein
MTSNNGINLAVEKWDDIRTYVQYSTMMRSMVRDTVSLYHLLVVCVGTWNVVNRFRRT